MKGAARLKRLRSRHCVTMVALCCGAASTAVSWAATGAGDSEPAPAKVVTFIEVRSDAIDLAKTILSQYESALRQHGAALRVETLEEIGRPERFVMLESATRADELTGPEAAAQTTLAPLHELLTAPLDRRANRAFRADTPSAAQTNPGASAASSTTSLAPPPRSPHASPAPSRALYAVTHLDLAPVDEARGTKALQHLVDVARQSPGNLRFEAWQQANRPNHFNLIASWSSRASLDEFTHSAAALEYRAIVAPLIGSPYDERLYQRLDTK